MIRHIVLVRFAAGIDPAEQDKVFTVLAALREQVEGMLAFAAGPNVSPEHHAGGYTHAFTMDFANAASRDAYLVHPAHVTAGTRLRGAADGDGGILVLDIETE